MEKNWGDTPSATLNDIFLVRLSDEAKIFTAEAKAIEQYEFRKMPILQYVQIRFLVFSLYII